MYWSIVVFVYRNHNKADELRNMENVKKRERGANYTNDENTLLADLVFKYKHIVEDKRTGGQFIVKKREVWATIAHKYNSCALTGPRSVDQLKMMYDNWKQKTRKSVAESNKAKYTVTSEEVSRALDHATEDKIEVNKTGGGAYNTKTTDNDEKILSILKDQIEPLTNEFDSGAAFFRDLDNEQVLECEVVSVEAEEAQKFIVDEQTETNKPDSENKKLKKKTAKKDELRTLKKKKKLSAESFKRIYFKRKCQVANLEKKKVMQEIIQNKQHHNLKMQVLKMKLNKYSN